MKVDRFVTGAFEENCYLIADEASLRAAVADPGADGEILVEAIRRAGVTLDAIWLTHAHVDHIGGIAAIRRTWPVPIFLHKADLPLYRAGAQQAAYYGLPFEAPPEPDEEFTEGMELTLGTLRFRVIHVPGHAPGHVAIEGEGIVLVGDVLFAGSIGRSDIPLADGQELERSLARLSQLPGETTVLPGHGQETTIAHELRTNPFLTGIARPLRR